MNLTSPSEVRNFLEEIGLRPNKVLGQNFLIDRNILNILVKSADLKSADHVLEIGGGLGVVTEELASRAGRVTVIEKDKRLAEHLAATFASHPNVHVICADAIDVLSGNNKEWKGKGQKPDVKRFDKVVANLPYSVGTKFLVDQIKSEQRPEIIVVTVQLEVAERFVARCGSKQYGVLSVWSHMHYDVDLIKVVKGTCFWPRPEVSSAILKFEANGNSKLCAEDEMFLYGLTKYAFGQRRKQMASILSHGTGVYNIGPECAKEIFTELNLKLSARPQTLSVSDWSKLAEAVRENSYNG